MAQSLEEALAYTQRWIGLIHKPTVSEEEGKRIIEESRNNFAEHFNKGWLSYRKSVTEAGDQSATEWVGSGAVFRGKTMGSLSMMGKADYRQPPGLLYGGPVYHVPFGDAEAVERQLEICHKVGVDIAAVLMETIQGEAGAIVPPEDFWPRLHEATRQETVLERLEDTLKEVSGEN